MIGQATPNTAPEIPTLAGDAAILRDRLNEINERVVKLGDHLLGGMPREASGKPAPEPPPSLRLHVDRMQALVVDISENLARIEARV